MDLSAFLEVVQEEGGPLRNTPRRRREEVLFVDEGEKMPQRAETKDKV